ncbi:MAG: hypothetical protein IPO21_15085 [Bacteroidales bacterium]|nr:hypothetical protein [Bacteroidales bacterium]
MKLRAGIVILLMLVSCQLFSTTYKSKVEYKGNWESNSSWQGGLAPLSFSNNDVIEINGTITSNSSITVDKQITIKVKDGDTLIIAGTLNLDYSSGSGLDMEVIGTGVVIVLGSLTTNKNLAVSNTGKLVCSRYFIQWRWFKYCKQFGRYLYCRRSFWA